MSWHHVEDTTPRARKPHRCYVCGDPILVGEKHVRRFGYHEEGPISIRMHVECEKKTENWDTFDWESHTPYDADDIREWRQELVARKTKEGVER